MKLFDIKYKNGNKVDTLSCSNTNLEDYKEVIIDKGWKILSVNEKPLPKKEPNKKSIEKNKYYYSKYGTEKRRLDNKRITKREFKTRIELLKKLREECKTKSEFKRNYEKVYK